jgi:ankyrin repeat protein
MGKLIKLLLLFLLLFSSIAFAKDNEMCLKLRDAAKIGDINKINELIYNGGDIDCTYGKMEKRPLIAAIQNKKYETISFIVDELRGEIDFEFKSKCPTPLMLAVKIKDLRIIQILLENDVDVNYKVFNKKLNTYQTALGFAEKLQPRAHYKDIIDKLEFWGAW